MFGLTNLMLTHVHKRYHEYGSQTHFRKRVSMFPDKVFNADDRLVFFSSLRREIVYKLPLFLIAASAMGVLIISLVQTTSPAGLILLWLAFELVCALAYVLRSSPESLSFYNLLVVSV